MGQFFYEYSQEFMVSFLLDVHLDTYYSYEVVRQSILHEEFLRNVAEIVLHVTL